jgi:hypothetical protein
MSTRQRHDHEGFRHILGFFVMSILGQGHPPVNQIVMAGLQISHPLFNLRLPPWGHRHISTVNLKFHSSSFSPVGINNPSSTTSISNADPQYTH